MFFRGNRASFGTFKSAAGVFYEDRYVPILEIVVNLCMSIPLAMRFGIKGVLFGTICSSLVVYTLSYPRYVYRLIFDKSIKTYIIDNAYSILQFVVAFVAVYVVNSFVNCDSAVLRLVITLAECCIIPNIVILLMNWKSNEFKYIRTTGLRLLKRTK